MATTPFVFAEARDPLRDLCVASFLKDSRGRGRRRTDRDYALLARLYEHDRGTQTVRIKLDHDGRPSLDLQGRTRFSIDNENYLPWHRLPAKWEADFGLTAAMWSKHLNEARNRGLLTKGRDGVATDRAVALISDVRDANGWPAEDIVEFWNRVGEQDDGEDRAEYSHENIDRWREIQRTKDLSLMTPAEQRAAAQWFDQQRANFAPKPVPFTRQVLALRLVDQFIGMHAEFQGYVPYSARS